jgi:membrane protease YdiL (CAAX protease family)
VCGFIARRRFGSLCPRWRVPPFVWPGLAVLGFFIAKESLPALVTPADQLGLFRLIYPAGLPPPPDGMEADRFAAFLKANWVLLGGVPLLLLAAVVVRGRVFDRPPDWRAGLRQLPRDVALGLLGCFTFGTAAMALQIGLTFLFEWWGVQPTEHPLSKMGGSGDGVGGVLLVLSACVTAPMLEEFLFRGLLVPWAGTSGRGRWWYRPWCLLFSAAALAVLLKLKPDLSFEAPALGFVLVLAAGAYLIQRFGRRWGKFPTRTVLAVWSSSALFAAAHSLVWPTPIPLFVLGLGLGYLAARTRSWAASAVMHATFNAVSAVWVFLRG